jgi:antitoxin component of RelBE/YafQ-DinJ toxin-antitoxin module
MKKKINLTLDEAVVIKTKKFVRSKGISVSHLVESLLKQAINESKISFSKKWQGQLKLANPQKSPRYKKLRERYF